MSRTMLNPCRTPSTRAAFPYVAVLLAWRTGPHRVLHAGVLADQAGPLRIEFPALDQVLHGQRIVAGAEPVLQVERVRGGQGAAVQLDAQSRTVRDLDGPAGNGQRV